MESQSQQLYRVAFIGDVHGQHKELEAMISDFEKHGVDRIVSLGDLFDRGPDAPKCLRIIKDRGFIDQHGNQQDIEMILGNHEDRNIRVWRQLPIPGRKKPPTPWSPKEFDAITEDEWYWLEQRPFCLGIKEHGLDLVAVHGGFTEDMQSPFWTGFDGGGRMARIGYLHEKDGTPLSPGGYSKRLWADEYDGRFGRAFYGHTSFNEVHFSDHAVGLDGTKRGKIFGIIVSNQEHDITFEQGIRGWSPLLPPVKHKKYSSANDQLDFSSSNGYVPSYYDSPYFDRDVPLFDEQAWELNQSEREWFPCKVCGEEYGFQDVAEDCCKAYIDTDYEKQLEEFENQEKVYWENEGKLKEAQESGGNAAFSKLFIELTKTDIIKDTE